MKKLYIFFIFFPCFSGFAQFNTIKYESKIYEVKEEREDVLLSDDYDEIEDEEEDYSDVYRNDSCLTDCVTKYLSVSYPLKNIVVTSGFGNRVDPFSKEIKLHGGVDLRARYEEVYCMLPGKVIKTGKDNRSGIHAVIQTGEYTIAYCHLSELAVKKNDMIRAGDIVGISGNTGRSTGPHLHLTCRLKKQYVNPLVLFDYVKTVKEEALREFVELKSVAIK